MFSPHCSLYISYGTDKENLFNNQERLKLVIISFILMTSMFVLGGDAGRENSNHSVITQSKKELSLK